MSAAVPGRPVAPPRELPRRLVPVRAVRELGVGAVYEASDGRPLIYVLIGDGERAARVDAIEDRTPHGVWLMLDVDGVRLRERADRIRQRRREIEDEERDLDHCDFCPFGEGEPCHFCPGYDG